MTFIKYLGMRYLVIFCFLLLAKCSIIDEIEDQIIEEVIDEIFDQDMKEVKIDSSCSL